MTLLTAYYNDNDPFCAEHLRGLIRDGWITVGEVDERPVQDVRPEDLQGFDRVHFFAGMGGWDLALTMAGFDRPCWTGSCPCQPFSVAGRQKGATDARHLWPAWFGLIRECRPDIVFGEQVPGAIGQGWLDGVSADLEGENYAVGSLVLGAHSIGAPHIRQRLWWVGHSTVGRSWPHGRQPEARAHAPGSAGGSGVPGRVAEQRGRGQERADARRRGEGAAAAPNGTRPEHAGGVADAEGRRPAQPAAGQCAEGIRAPQDGAARPDVGSADGGVADTGRGLAERQREPGDIRGTACEPEEEGDQRERRGPPVGDCGTDDRLADAEGGARRPGHDLRPRQPNTGPSCEAGRVADAGRVGLRERDVAVTGRGARQEPEQLGGAGGVADADLSERRRTADGPGSCSGEAGGGPADAGRCGGGVADSGSGRRQNGRPVREFAPRAGGETGPAGMADASGARSPVGEGAGARPEDGAGRGEATQPAGGGLEDADCDGWPAGEPAAQAVGYWNPSVPTGCYDGKLRRVGTGVQPLAHGLPAGMAYLSTAQRRLAAMAGLDGASLRRAKSFRVGTLRGLGNAIVPPVAAAFVMLFMETLPTDGGK